MNEFNYYRPTTGAQVLRAAPPGTAMFLYSDLASDPRPPEDVLMDRMARNNIILYQDPHKMNSGHWTSLSFKPETREAYFFSSYGGMPDREKMRWLKKKDLRRSGQARNVINDGLKYLARNGWTVHYNDHPYQIEGDDTATCGIWSTAFLNSGLNPDEFYEVHEPVERYFERYFK